MRKALLLSAFLAVAAASQAASVTIDVTGATSAGFFADPGNSVFTQNIGAGSTVTGIEFNVNVTAYDPSLLYELAWAVYPTGALDGVSDYLSYNPSDDRPGTGTISSGGLLNFDSESFEVGADGLLNLELFEDFDDDGLDALYNSGSFTVHYTNAVPEPASMAALGFGALALLRRRRKSA
ncbi:PEP-CTERM sorting domain-containing protein [bacterium]|nr:MAG: PEP-CTERM sorting domain-containing protein [bacterium]